MKSIASLLPSSLPAAVAASVAVLLALAACTPTPPAGPADIRDFMMPADRHAAVVAAEQRSVIVDRGPDFDSDVVPITIQLLRTANVTRTAEFRYRIKEAGGTAELKVKVFGYAAPADCLVGWELRYPAGAASWQDWNAGEQGARVSGRERAFRLGAVLVQIAGELDDQRLEAFARTYADHVSSLLRPATWWQRLLAMWPTS